MPEELGFRTPAKEIEKLQKSLERIEDVRVIAVDALKLSMLAFLRVFWGEAVANPKDARRTKDELLESVKKYELSPWVTDAVDAGFKAVCDTLDKHLSQKSN